MKDMSRSQKIAMIVIAAAVVGILVLLMFLVNPIVGFILLVLAILGLCVLKLKCPQVLEIPPKAGSAAAKTDFLPVNDHSSGFRAHIVLLYQGGMTTQQITVDREEFTIGRHSSCSFQLSGNRDISRKHAIIRYDADRGVSTITDNNSSHGTKVNGESLAPGQPRTLHNGDLIQIEDRILTVQNKNY